MLKDGSESHININFKRMIYCILSLFFSALGQQSSEVIQFAKYVYHDDLHKHTRGFIKNLIC